MVKSSRLSTPDTSITMRSLFVDRIGETFTDDAPLKSEITVIIECGTFVRTPTHGAVVYDNVLVRFCTIHCVVTFLFDVDSHTGTDETDDYIVCLNRECIVFQANAITRSCLSCNGHITIAEF